MPHLQTSPTVSMFHPPGTSITHRTLQLALVLLLVSGTFLQGQPKDQQYAGHIDAVAAKLSPGGAIGPQGATDLNGAGSGTLFGTDPIVGKLYRVNAGSFTQGTPLAEAGRKKDEGAPFPHVLTRSLAVMETAVTRQMWADLKTGQPDLPLDPTCTEYGSGMANPVQCVTWYQSVLYANLLSKQRGLQPAYYIDVAMTSPIGSDNFQTNNLFVNWNANGYRLPTEGEREYFARAGTTGPFWIHEPAYSSSTSISCTTGQLAALEAVAWFCANSQWCTHPMGDKKANPWGLKNVHGNVWEWCWDWYASYPGSKQTDYRGPLAGSYRVLRGGYFIGYPEDARSGNRYYYNPGYYDGNFGFRLLRSADQMPGNLAP